MKKLLNTSLIVIFLLNISCVKIKNEFSDIETYELEGTWELYEGENKIKKIIECFYFLFYLFIIKGL